MSASHKRSDVRKIAFMLAMLALLFLLMGDVNLQTSQPVQSQAVDWTNTVHDFGQFALLVWLIIRSEQRLSEQQRAWRDERRWLLTSLYHLPKPPEGEG